MSERQSDHVKIFDTSLRDGEQAPGCSMTEAEKLRLATTLAHLGVDVIEAGYPAASPGDFAAVKRIAESTEGSRICGLARCVDGDIDAAGEALANAKLARIHVFIATSPIHREHKLGMNKAEVVAGARAGVERARRYCDDIEFSAEDASRTEPEFLCEVVTAAIEAGASTINIPDTVGYSTPDEFGAIFKMLRENVPGIENVTLSAHCHNDLGLAVANSLAAVANGARQVECTLTGIGERAGNCALEEVVMALRTRADCYGVSTKIETTGLYRACRQVAGVTGIPTPRNKAIIGDNAFSHEAGIHQHGMLKNANTYEIMRPQDVGIARSSLVLGKHSGRHAVADHLQRLGFELDAEELARVFKDFKRLADRKREILDDDLEALVLRRDAKVDGPWDLAELQVNSIKGGLASAAVALQHKDGRIEREASVADGPIEAIFQAIRKAVGSSANLTDFDVHSVTRGDDAQGEATVTLVNAHGDCRGKGFHTDILEASARAILQAINLDARHAQDAGRRIPARTEQATVA